MLYDVFFFAALATVDEESQRVPPHTCERVCCPLRFFSSCVCVCVSCTRAHWPVSIICNVFVLLLFAAAAAAYDVVCVTFCRNICARTCCIVCCVWPPVGNPARASVCVRERARASRASVVESASNARAPAHTHVVSARRRAGRFSFGFHSAPS